MPGYIDKVSFSYSLGWASLHSPTIPSAVEPSAGGAKEVRVGQELQTISQIA